MGLQKGLSPRFGYGHHLIEQLKRLLVAEVFFGDRFRVVTASAVVQRDKTE